MPGMLDVPAFLQVCEVPDESAPLQMQAQRLAADSIVVVFAATLADVQRKRHCWEACEQSLKFGTLANAAAETCCCQCSSYRSALLARVSGDCLRKRGCEAQALQCYSSALVHFPILKLSKKGMFPAVECIRARMGIAKCSAVLDDHGHAKEALARAADDLGFDM